MRAPPRPLRRHRRPPSADRRPTSVTSKSRITWWASGSIRSAHPSKGPHTPSSPVSSRSSRVTASTSVSPASTLPPGTLHSPCAGPRPRRTSSSRSWSTTHRADAEDGAHESERCTTIARATSPNDSKKFLRVPISGQGEAVDAEAALVGAPVDEGLHGDLPDAQLATARLRVEVGHDTEQPAVGEPLDPRDAVAHHGVVERCPRARGGRPRSSSCRRAASNGGRRAVRRAHTSPPRPARSSSMAAPTSSTRRGTSASTAGRQASSAAPAISCPAAGRPSTGSSCGRGSSAS